MANPIQLPLESDGTEYFGTMTKAIQQLGDVSEESKEVQTATGQMFNPAIKVTKEYTQTLTALDQQLARERNAVTALKQAYDNQAASLKNNTALTEQQKKSLQGSVEFSLKALQAAEQRTAALEEQRAALVKMKDQEDQLNVSTQAAGKSIADMRREIKDLISQANAEGLDTLIGQELLQRAASLKDELSDLQLQVKNLGSDTRSIDAVNEGVQVFAATAGIAAGASALLGDENEDLQKSLLQLNAIMAITNGLQQIGNALQAQSAFRLGLSRAAASAYSGAQRLLGVSVTESAASVRSFNAALSGNALGAILAYVTAVVTFREEIIDVFDSLPKKLGILGRVIQVLFLPVRALAEVVTQIGNAFNYLSGASSKATTTITQNNEALINSTEQVVDRELTAINRRYDTEIALAQATGKITTELEKEKQEAILTTLRIQEAQLRAQLQATASFAKAIESFTKGDINTELKEKLQEVQDSIADAEAEITIIEATGSSERSAKFKEEQDKRVALYKEAAQKIIELTEQASEAELEQLSGQGRIEALRARGERELAEITRQLQAANKVIAETSNDAVLQALVDRGRLTEDQYEILRILRVQNETEIQNEILALQRQESDAQIALMQEGTAKQIAQINAEFEAKRAEYIRLFGAESDEVKALEANTQRAIQDATTQGGIARLNQQEQLAQQQAELLKVNGATEVELNLIKEQKKLETTIFYAKERLKVLLNEIGPGGPANAAQQAAINNQLIAIQEGEKKLIAAKQKTAEELNKIDLLKAIFPNVTGENLEKIKGAITDVYTQILGIITAAVDQQIEQNQRALDNLNTKIGETQQQIEIEAGLAEEGLANNLDLERENLQKLQQEREKALQEQEKLAKRKAAIETVQQVVSLITAAANIFNSLSAIPFVGVPLAITAIGLMFAAFAATKAQAASAAGGGFKKGGYTGGTSTDEERGPVHGLEFVVDAHKTKKNRKLLEGIHNDDRDMISRGIHELLENTGITLNNEKALSRVKFESRSWPAFSTGESHELQKVRKELTEIKEMFADKIGFDKGKPSHTGNEIKKGNTITILRK